ncbi:hypothetical protein [Xanthomonas sp. NCPPB 1128]|nr:hypothetical protein [Xanthomonas sp. NCPPB 1128]
MDMQALARQIFEAQPFSRLIGARLSVLGDAQAEIVVDMRDDLRQQH